MRQNGRFADGIILPASVMLLRRQIIIHRHGYILIKQIHVKKRKIEKNILTIKIKFVLIHMINHIHMLLVL
jgi:hypothetical protein